jgi:hypothetical protein
MHLTSPLVEAAWSGRLLHLSGLDVTGSTAGSLSRIFQDREVELWAGKRIVGSATEDEVCCIAIHITAESPLTENVDKIW